MKSHWLLIASALLVSGTALASNEHGTSPLCPTTLTCHSSTQVAEARRSGEGFVVEFKVSDRGKSLAVVESIRVSRKDKERTYRTLGELECKHATAQPNPDETRVIATCHEPKMADAGYSLELLSPDFAGVQRAKLYEESFGGRREAATLLCRVR